MKILLLSTLIHLAFYSASCEENSTIPKDETNKNFCYLDEKDTQICSNTEETDLYRWDPVSVGHTREMQLEENQIHKMVTRSIYPPIFEIPNFLNDDECDLIISKAKEKNMFKSGLFVNEKVNETQEIRNKLPLNFSFDLNHDNKVSFDEIKKIVKKFGYFDLLDEDVTNFFIYFDLLTVGDSSKQYFDKDRFEQISIDRIIQYFIDLKMNVTRFKDRASSQVWLDIHSSDNSFLNKIHLRLQKLTKFPYSVIYQSENLQVVHYGHLEHYYDHYDSTGVNRSLNLPCCHVSGYNKPSLCILCRYSTILYYLNNVEKGGQTAFPLASAENISITEAQRKYGLYTRNSSELCFQLPLSISPKKGTAVFWYNHRNVQNGSLGELDDQSMHRGCDVIEGEKWIANNWINYPRKDLEHSTNKHSTKTPG